MREGMQSKSRRWFRYYLLISTGVLLVLAAYTAWIFYARYREKNAADARVTAAQQAREREKAARTYETLGGSEFAILNFYALPTQIHPGQSSTICYGVSNAKVVRLDPPAEEVWPSVSRCFDVTPKMTTTYRLTIEDGAGHSKSSTVTLEVR